MSKSFIKAYFAVLMLSVWNINVPMATAFNCPATTHSITSSSSTASCNRECGGLGLGCTSTTQVNVGAPCGASSCNIGPTTGYLECDCSSPFGACNDSDSNDEPGVASTCTDQKGTYNDFCDVVGGFTYTHEFTCECFDPSCPLGFCFMPVCATGYCHDITYQFSVVPFCRVDYETLPAVCGNGQIDFNEVCDSSAVPTRCTAPNTCNSTCTACVLSSSAFVCPGTTVTAPAFGNTCDNICAGIGQVCVQSTECPVGWCDNDPYAGCGLTCVAADMGCECSATATPCVDTDGPHDSKTAGTCTDSSGNFSDSCSSAMVAVEWWCNNAGNCTSRTGNCSMYDLSGRKYSCDSGACVETCTDSDGWSLNDRKIAGTCVSSVGSIGTFLDTCTSAATGTEWYCAGSAQGCFSIPFNCTAGETCVGGACTSAAVCVPGPCDGICNDGCAVAQDPDCDCQNGNGCCPLGCTNTTDDDCLVSTCGNGIINYSFSNEVCDFSAMPIGCPPLQTCNAGCTACENHLCGDGIIDVGETCDFSAMPTGCGALVCNGNCTACISGSCSPNTCNPLNPNQYCVSGLWVNCPGNKACSGAGVCGASTIPLCDLNAGYYCSPLSIIKTFSQASEAFLRYILGIIGIAALLFIVIAGIMYITSAGSEERITASKRILNGSVTGVGIALLAYSLLRIITSILNGM